jgi:hypothetical protein
VADDTAFPPFPKRAPKNPSHHNCSGEYRDCKVCGARFYTRPSEDRRGYKRQHCSLACCELSRAGEGNGRFVDRTRLREYILEHTKRMPNGCLEWQGNRTQAGYGRCYIGGKETLAHRLSYAVFVRDPGDLMVCHSCDNPACCDWTHLFEGDAADNARDMAEKGRCSHGAHPNFGEKNGSSKLTQAQVEAIRSRLEIGEGTTPIAKAFGVTTTTIRNIRTGKNWGHS